MEPLVVTLGGAVIGGLVTAVVALWKANNNLQEKRINDAKEVNKKITAPLKDLTDLTEKIYDAIPKTKRGK